MVASGDAGVRRFTYIYEATTSVPGSVELENDVAWERLGPHESGVEFRHELEFGVTDRLQASIYLADWSYTRSRENSGFTYSDSAVELIYNLTSPVIDPVGLALYQEVRLGERLLELESKVIAQKDYGPWIVAYNATLEAVWEGEGWNSRSGEFQQVLGVSREICPSFSVGLELLHEFIFPDWRDQERTRNLFVGPNASYRRGKWFVTVTALAQATQTESEPGFQVRGIFGAAF